MPTRKALIIGSAYKDDDIRPGVLKDLANWKKFLRSPTGGAWRENEITVLDTEDDSEVFDAMANLFGVDFVLVVFTGHGCLGVLDRSANMAVTNIVVGGTEVPENFIYPEAKKSMVIMDCCRGISPATIILESLDAVEAAGLVTHKTASMSQRIEARTIYDNAIEVMDEARVVIYSASQEVLASGPDDIGGVFTHYFLEGACEFDIANERIARLHGDVRKANVVYASEAVRWARPRVNEWRRKRNKPPQNPVYSSDRLLFPPPIAIRI